MIWRLLSFVPAFSFAVTLSNQSTIPPVEPQFTPNSCIVMAAIIRVLKKVWLAILP